MRRYIPASAGEDWTITDPWWCGGKARTNRFSPDGRSGHEQPHRWAFARNLFGEPVYRVGAEVGADASESADPHERHTAYPLPYPAAAGMHRLWAGPNTRPLLGLTSALI